MRRFAWLLDFDSAVFARLALGDLLAILAFVVLGERQHNVDPVANPDVVLGTLLPFLVGWIVFALLLGAYGSAAFDGEVAHSFARTAAAWLGADLLAQALRATETFRGDADPVFFLVAGSVGLALLFGWRLVARRTFGDAG